LKLFQTLNNQGEYAMKMARLVVVPAMLAALLSGCASNEQLTKMQSAIDKAQTTADEAKAIAIRAESKADQAQSTANQALSVANDAKQMAKDSMAQSERMFKKSISK
jgi:hypothetical protein